MKRLLILLICLTFVVAGTAIAKDTPQKGTQPTAKKFVPPKGPVGLVPREDKGPAAAVCFITDSAGNVVSDVWGSSYFLGYNYGPYYLWFSPSYYANTEKFLLKFYGYPGLSKQIHKVNYSISSAYYIAVAFAYTAESSAAGPSLLKVKTDYETCGVWFNAVP